MTRRRPPVCDYICRRCGCACDQAGTRHLGQAVLTIHQGEKTGMTFVSCSCGWNLHGTGTAQLAGFGAEHYVNHVEACGKPPDPVLRSEFEAEAQAIAQQVRDRYGYR